MIPVINHPDDFQRLAQQAASQLLGILAAARAAGVPLKLSLEVATPAGMNLKVAQPVMSDEAKVTFTPPVEVRWIEVKG